MHCYFFKGGQIEAVEELSGLSEDEAVKKAHLLFSERDQLFDGFELWQLTRLIAKHPPNAKDIVNDRTEDPD